MSDADAVTIPIPAPHSRGGRQDRRLLSPEEKTAAERAKQARWRKKRDATHRRQAFYLDRYGDALLQMLRADLPEYSIDEMMLQALLALAKQTAKQKTRVRRKSSGGE